MIFLLHYIALQVRKVALNEFNMLFYGLLYIHGCLVLIV